MLSLILGLTRYKLFKIFTNLRFWIGILFAFLITNSYVFAISEYSREIGKGVSVWLLPFLLDYPYTAIVYGIVIVLLFCDAPFIESNEPYLLTRTKRSHWFIAQILYVAVMSIVLTLFLFILSILVILPNIEFTSSWGTIIQTIANTSASYDLGSIVDFNQYILTNFSPLEASLYSAFFFFLACFLIASFMFVVNLFSNRYVGAGISVIFAFMIILTQNSNIAWYHFSPLSWARLSCVDFNYNLRVPTPMYIITVSIIVSSIFWTIAYFKFKKSDINPQRGIVV